MLGHPWALLPIEIKSRIIELVRDTKTLDALCEATKSNSTLYQTALQTRWADVTLFEDDLLAEPHWCDRLEHQWPPPKRLLCKIATTICGGIQPHLTPAAYIKHLFLNLDFLITEPPRSSEELICKVEGVAYEGVLYSFRLLFPQLINLVQLEVEGVLCQEQLECITKIDSLRILRLRYTSCCHGIEQRDGRRRQCNDIDTICWDSLARLRQIRRLEIGHIFPEESSSLAGAIARLENLENLVASAGIGHGPDTDWHGSRPSSLDYFVNILLRRGYHFPSKIKSLAFADVVPNGLPFFAKGGRPETLVPSEQSNDLYLDIEDIDQLKKILSAPRFASLSRLAISGAALLTDDGVKDLIPLIYKCRKTLTQITLLDTWSIDPVRSFELDSIFNDHFIVEDLVVGGSNLNKDIEQLVHGINQDIYGNLQPPWRYTDQAGNKKKGLKWSTSLQRIRIDQISLNDLAFGPLTASSYPCLKILIVRPWKLHGIGRPAVSHTYRMTVIDEFYDHPTAECDRRAEFLASQVLAKGLPKLQVLVIAGYWFWIVRNPHAEETTVGTTMTTEQQQPTILRFSEAQDDPVQSREMVRCLSARDWDFLRDVPPTPTEESPNPGSTVT